MAEAFNKEFQIRVATATDQPVAAAEAAFNNVVVPKLEDIDLAGLAQIDSFIKNAKASLEVITDPISAAGVIFKTDLAEMIKKDILAGAQLNLSGIRSGLSSEAFLAAAQATGSTTVNNNYTIQVTADSRVSGSKAGEAIIEKLTGYTRTNGSSLVVGLL
jgi:hypothetical protein